MADVKAGEKSSIKLDEAAVRVSSHSVLIERRDTWFDPETRTYQGSLYHTIYDEAQTILSWSNPEETGYSFQLQFSDNKDFFGRTIIYDPSAVIVRGETATKVTFNQDARAPMTLLSSIANPLTNEIYWRVVAYKQGSEKITSDTGSFVFVDNKESEDPEPIRTEASPAKASVSVDLVREDVSDKGWVCNGKINITVTSEKSNLGIAGYYVTLTNKKTGGSREWSVGYNENPEWIRESGNTNYFTLSCDLSSAEYFGADFESDYVVSVTTYDACNHSTQSSDTVFTVSTVAPDPVGNVQLYGSLLTVLVSWDAAQGGDAANYVVKWRHSGGAWSRDCELKVKGNVTSALISLYGDGYGAGDYDFSVVAEDKSGNRSIDTQDQSISVSKWDEFAQREDFADTYDECTELSWDDSTITAKNTIGWGDTADYFWFECGISCTVSVDLSFLEVEKQFNAQKSKGIKVELYKYDGTGKEKPVKSVSVTSEKPIISDLKLYGGTYFAKVTANNTSVVDKYRLDFVKKDFSTEEFNTTADDDWTDLEDRYVIAEGGTFSDWVGFGDKIDYRKLDITKNGSYLFVLNTESNDPGSLTIYQKNGTSLNKLTTISSKKGITETSVLLDKRNEYYISVSPSGDNSGYLVDFKSLHYYDDGNQKISNDDDDWQTLDPKFTITKITEEDIEEWVGFSDTIDYRQIKLEKAGCYNLTLSGISNKVVFTVYQQVGENKLRKITALTLAPRDGKTATGRIGNLFLDSETNGACYYVSISAPDGNLEKNSEYWLSLSGTEAYKAINEDDDWRTLDETKYTISTGESVEDEWVGFGDAIDYRKIDLSSSGTGSYDFTISGVGAPVILTVYQEIGGELVKRASKTVTGYEDTLADVVLNCDHRDEESGRETYSYYLSVECQKYDGKHDSDYRLEMTGPKFDKARCEDNWPDLAVNGGTSVNVGDFETLISDYIGKQLERKDDYTVEKDRAENWVGYGDAVDYVHFSLGCAAKLVFGLETEGKAALTVYSLQEGERGYSLKKLGTAGTELWLLRGDYYIAVTSQDESVDADIDYAVKVSDGEFFTKSYSSGNTDGTWQEALAHQSSPWEVFESDMDPVEDWVGFGNGADFWRLQLKADGRLEVALDADTVNAYRDKKISFELLGNQQGNRLALDWDAASGCLVSRDAFAADNICYLGVVCNDVKKYSSVDYKLTFAVKTLQKI